MGAKLAPSWHKVGQDRAQSGLERYLEQREVSRVFFYANIPLFGTPLETKNGAKLLEGCQKSEFAPDSKKSLQGGVLGSLLEGSGPHVGLLEAAKRRHVEDMWDMGACNAQRSGEVPR